MPDDKPFDLPPFTSAWGFVINNVGIYDFVLGWLTLQSISKDHKRAVGRHLTGSQASPREWPRSSSVTEAAVSLKIRRCFRVTSLCSLVICSPVIFLFG